MTSSSAPARSSATSGWATSPRSDALNPRVYDEDESLRRLIDVVPFGVADEAPMRTGPGIRGVVAGISADDKVIIWGGGIYNWFDPAARSSGPSTDSASGCPTSACSSWARSTRTPTCRRCASPSRPSQLAEELGLLDEHVFFNDGWVPYDERQNFLLDADIGVSTHFAARRDGVLVPDPRPRLLLGRAARRHDGG